MTKIQEMVKHLEIQVREARDSMNDAKQYGVNSAGYNAYMGQWEMATTLLVEARRLAAEEAKEKPRLMQMDTKTTDLWGQHKQMIKLAQDHGLFLAANWAVNMSGKTFSEEKPTAPASLVMKIKIMANKYGRARDMFIDDCHNILSCYRPASQDIVGELKEWATSERNKNAHMVDDAVWGTRYQVFCEILERIRKYEEGK